MLRPEYRPGPALNPPTPLAGQRGVHAVVEVRDVLDRLDSDRAAPGAAYLDLDPGTAPPPGPGRYRDRDVQYPVGRVRPGYQRQPVHGAVPAAVADRARRDRLARLGEHGVVHLDAGGPGRGTADERAV